MLNFLNDPTGEMPWEEEEGTEDIRHLKTGKVSNIVTFRRPYLLLLVPSVTKGVQMM